MNSQDGQFEARAQNFLKNLNKHLTPTLGAHNLQNSDQGRSEAATNNLLIGSLNQIIKEMGQEVELLKQKLQKQEEIV